MKPTNLAAAACLTLGICVSALAQQAGTEWVNMHQKVAELTREGKNEDALALAHQAVALAQQKVGPAHRDVAVSLWDLAILQERTKDDKGAEASYLRAMAIYQKIQGAEAANVGMCAESLATLYDRGNEYDKAAPLYERAVAVRLQELGENHPAAGA